MPIYEFCCASCARRQSLFYRSFSIVKDPACEQCGSLDMQRLVSRVAIGRTLADIHDRYDAPRGAADLDYYSDPRNIGRWAEQQASEIGVELPGEVRSMIDAARDGEMPGAVKDI